MPKHKARVAGFIACMIEPLRLLKPPFSIR